MLKRSCPTPWPDRWAMVLIILIGAMHAWYGLFVPMLGDDMSYSGGFIAKFGSLTRYVRYAGSHYLATNGRLTNLLAPMLLLGLPKWLLSLLTGMGIALSYYLTVKAAGLTRRMATAKISLIGLILFTFPWWDSAYLYVVAWSYPCATALALGAVIWMLRGVSSSGAWLAWPLAFGAGMTHEALSIPLVCGLAAYFTLTRQWRTLSRNQTVMLLLFIAGATCVFISPALWHRVTASHTPDDPMWLLALKSDFYVLALIACTAAAAVMVPRRLREAVHTPWVIFAVAAVISLIPSVGGGIVGRSGWFAQTFALIAFYRWGVMCGWHIRPLPARILSSVLSVLILLHLAEVARWQRVSGTELTDSISTYAADPSQPVYMDYTRQDAQPIWVLNKTRGVIDPTETYLLDMMARYDGDSIHPYRVLPTAVRAMATDTLSGPAPVGGDSYIAPSMPGGCGPDGILTLHGVRYISVPFTKDGRSLWFITPLYLHPGDRL